MAIKVNGTTVINDSRQLQNVASVDATTVAALGAAGVGGSLEFLSETNITSNVSYIDISFPTGYRGFKIAFNRIVLQDYGYYVVDFFLRLKNSSGNLITSTDYAYSEHHILYGYNSTYLNLGVVGPPGVTSGVPNNRAASFFVTIMNPRVSDVTTSIISEGGAIMNDADSETRAFRGLMGTMHSAQDNVGMRVYTEGNPIGSGSKSYSVWGIK